MKIFFTADTHFSAERTLEFSQRPFKNVEEMDATMIENWNRVVGKDDTVIHLGDFGNLDISRQLNGRIVLLFGNYERKDYPVDTPEDRTKHFEFFKSTYNNITPIFEEVYTLNTPLTVDDKKYILSLSHEPLVNSLPSKKSGCVNLFGHIHKLCMVKPYGLNVGTDCHNFTPISYDTLTFYINAIANHYDKFVFT